MAQTIRSHLAASHIAEVRGWCFRCKGAGAGYGFGLLSEAAGDAVKSLDASQSLSESRVEVEMVTNMCQRLSAGPADTEYP